MKKKKIFRMIPDRLYGQVLDEITGEIGVNVQYIWNKTRNQNKFIKEFTQTLSHEIIHLQVGSILEDIYYVGEERSIRRLLKEKWNKQLEEWYEKEL